MNSDEYLGGGREMCELQKKELKVLLW